MAIHFVLIYYLISHCAILAKSFGKETSNQSSAFFPEASNSSLVPITFDAPRPYFSTNRPRPKYVLPSPNQSIGTTKRNGFPTNNTRLFQQHQRVPSAPFRPRFPSLSSFVPMDSAHHHNTMARPRNLTNYPRILLPQPPPPLSTEKYSNANLVTASPILITTTNSSVFGDGFITSTEAFPAFNMNSSHIKLANSQHNQRVVLNNIQDIISSMKIANEDEPHASRNKSTAVNEKVKSTLVPNAAGSPLHSPLSNHSSNHNNQSSIFKLRFIEKLRQNENILKDRLSHFSKPVSNLSAGESLKQKPPRNNYSLMQHVLAIPQNNNSSNLPPPRIEPQPQSFSGHKKSASNSPNVGTPSMLKSRTQWMNQLVPFHLMSSKLSRDFERKGSLIGNRTSEGDHDESKFMSHLKDLLFRFENEPHAYPMAPVAPLIAERSELSAPGAARPAASSPLMSTNFDTSHIDYGEVERILAYVNPYGRRISMPHSHDFSLAESQMHEGRNLRFQRSSPIERWLNDSSLSFDSQDTNEPLYQSTDHSARWNSILSLTGQPNYATISSKFDLANFTSSNELKNQKNQSNNSNNLRAEQSVDTPKRVKLTYGMRNNVNSPPSDHQSELNDKDGYDIDFSWVNPNRTTRTKVKQEQQTKAPTKNVTTARPHRPFGSVRSLLEIAKSPIDYNPQESEYVRYPAPKLVGSEKFRRLNSSFFSDHDRDWVSYFSDLEHKMRASRNRPPATSHNAARLNNENRETANPESMDQIPELSELSPYEQPSPSVWSKGGGGHRNPLLADITLLSSDRPHRPRPAEHYQPPIPIKKRPNLASSRNTANRPVQTSIIPAAGFEHSVPDHMHFRPPAPYHLSRVINYVSGGMPPAPAYSPPNMAYYYLPHY